MKLRSLLVFSIALLAGCAAVTFKPGASPESMAADEKACRAASADEATYSKCMRERGAFVGGGAAIEATPTVAANLPPATATPIATEAATPRPTDQPTTAARHEAATPTAIPMATANPSSLIKVESWWKLGGNAADLDRAIAACVKKLGEAHRPDADAREVTGAMRDCLRAAGWRAYEAP